MKTYEYWLVHYAMGDLDQEVKHPLRNCVERQLVLVPHDKMTSQANDAPEKAWVLEDQHQLRKEGVGQGLRKVTPFVQQSGSLKKQARLLSMAKTMEGIGWVSCL